MQSNVVLKKDKKIIKNLIKLFALAIIATLILNVLISNHEKSANIDLFSLSELAFATNEWQAYRYLWYNHGDPCTCDDGTSGTHTACSRKKSYLMADDCNPNQYPYVLCIRSSDSKQCN